MNKYLQRFKTTKERFWERVDKRSDNECWNWIGGKDPNGYGYFWAGYRTKSHRYSWVIHFGDIHDGLFVCHKCDNPSCVNPKHLYLGTAKDNITDMIVRGRGNFIYGEKQPNHKLESQDIILIRKLYRIGAGTQLQLANDFDVSFQQISKIVNNQRWTHLQHENI